MKLDSDLRRAAALFALLTLWFLYPLWTDLGNLLHENGDSRLNAWIMSWDAHALATSPTRLFDANAFHPYDDSLALSENLLGSAILVAPINWLGQPVLAYNLVLLAAFFLTGVITWLWVRRITGSSTAALVTSVLWTFAPNRLDHLPHLQLLTAWWIPASLLAFEYWLGTGRRRYAVLAGALYGWQYLAGIQLALLFAPLVAIWVCVRVAQRQGMPAAGPGRLGADLLAAALMAALLVIPVSLPYLEVHETHGLERAIEGLHPAPMQSLLGPSWMNRVGYMQRLHQRYGGREASNFPGLIGALLFVAAVGTLAIPFGRRLRRLGGGLPAPRALVHTCASVIAAGSLAILAGSAWISSWVDPAPWHEALLALAAAMRPGLLFPIAGLVALLSRERSEPDDRQALIALSVFLACTAYLLTLGPEITDGTRAYGPGPHGWLHALVLPYRSIRAIGRFGLPMVFFGSVAGGLAAHDLLRRIDSNRARRVALSVLIALLAWELRTAPVLATVAHDGSWVYQRLGELPGRGAVMHLPGQPPPNPAATTRYMLGSTQHWRPLVNGYSGFLFPESERLVRTRTYDQPFFDRLRRDFTPAYLVVHREPPLSDDTFDAFVSGALYGRNGLEPVDVRADAAIFRVRYDTARGAHVYRRHNAAFVRSVESVEFTARAPAGAASLQVWWGSQLIGNQDVDASWQDFRLAVPPSWTPHVDGTLTVAWRSAPDSAQGVAIGNGGTMLRADVLVDAQPSGVSVAIDDRVRAGAPAGGLVALLAHDGAAVEAWRRFDIDARGARRLLEFVRAIEAGRLVAIAATGVGDRSDLDDLRDAVQLVGGTLGESTVPARLAVLGARDTVVGTAYEEGSGGRAAVRAGPRVESAPVVQLRRIRMLPSDP